MDYQIGLFSSSTSPASLIGADLCQLLDKNILFSLFEKILNETNFYFLVHNITLLCIKIHCNFDILICSLYFPWLSIKRSISTFAYTILHIDFLAFSSI